MLWPDVAGRLPKRLTSFLNTKRSDGALVTSLIRYITNIRTFSALLNEDLIDQTNI